MRSKKVGFVSFLSALLLTVLHAGDNDMNIISEDADESDVIEVLIRGNGGYCSLWMDSLGRIENTDCRRMTNSKKVKIVCTKRKEICKTEKEVYLYLKKKLSSPQKEEREAYPSTNRYQEESDLHEKAKVRETVSVMEVSDFILDYNKLQNTEVCVQGDIGASGEMTLLADRKNGSTSVMVDTASLPRSLRKQIMQQCTFMSPCQNHVVCGYVDNSLLQFGKTLKATTIK